MNHCQIMVDSLKTHDERLPAPGCLGLAAMVTGVTGATGVSPGTRRSTAEIFTVASREKMGGHGFSWNLMEDRKSLGIS